MATIKKLKKDWFVLFYALPFFKDALWWNQIYWILKVNKGDNKQIDNPKLIHIATISLEMIMKSILLLSFYDSTCGCKISMWLKNYGHNLCKVCNVLKSKYRIDLSNEQKFFLKKRSLYWIDYRYKMDAFFYAEKTSWISADIFKNFVDYSDEEFLNYEKIFELFQNLFEKIVVDEYWVDLDLFLNWKLQIPNIQFFAIKSRYK